ncbi:MAG: hypothetical protein GX591_11350 [Planctomycetes bacterium]|nr:hypothetical protein [Planctomycetota bacterium]
MRRSGLRSGGVMAAAAVVAAALLAGCGTAGPPTTLAALEAAGPAAREKWGPQKTALHNLRRVQDERLDPASRIASLSVVVHEVGPHPWYLSELATILTAGRAPQPVRQAVLGLLAIQDDPQAEPHVLAALRESVPGGFQQALLDWLTRHPHPAWLSDVVCLWSQADPSDDATEVRFRRAVETMSGRTWSQALLDGLNRPGFTARRSALDVLASRLAPDDLKGRIADLPPWVAAVEALQYCIARAGYLPSSEDLLAVVETYAARRDRLDAAIAVAGEWAAAGPYAFTIGDVHLLAGLANDETLRSGRRGPLLSRLDAELRAQARRGSAGVGGQSTPLEDLSTATLVRLCLLNAMLDRPGVAGALGRRCLSQGPAWGGLIVLDDGVARPRLYESASPAAEAYQPSGLMCQDARFCLAHLHGGPAAAGFDRLGTPGLAVWPAGAGRLAAVYYEGDGTRVPLGVFPMGAPTD